VTTVLPAPNGQDLVVDIDCTTHPLERTGTTHEVTIHPDWTVDTVHDLEGERIARAVGGWSSCLHFAESVVPAYRHMLEVMAEPSLVPRGVLRGWWINTNNMRTLDWHEADHVHRSLAKAVAHEIQEHAVTLHISSEWEFPTRTLATPLIAQYNVIAKAGLWGWLEGTDASCVRGGRGSLWELCQAGIHPTTVARIARWVPRSFWPLPKQFFTTVHFHLRVRRRKVAATIDSDDVLTRGWFRLAKASWYHGFVAALGCVALAVAGWVLPVPAWNAAVAFWQGRVVGFADTDSWDRESLLAKDPFRTYLSHKNELGTAVAIVSPTADAASLFFDIGAGTDERISFAELRCGDERVPMEIEDRAHAFAQGIPAGCRFLSFAISDGTGALSDFFDLTGEYVDGDMS